MAQRKPAKNQKKPHLPQHWWMWSFVILFFVTYVSSLFLGLPDVRQISSFQPVESTKIYSADGKIISTLHEEENRIVVPLNEIAFYLKNAVMASEDSRFYSHAGIDIRSIGRAIFQDLTHASLIEGGSTITQQLARSLFLTRARTVSRKISEIILALLIERNYSKDEIIELYLNQIYWGHNAYGIGAAANIYFGKTPGELDLAESALLAGLLKGPEIYSPQKNLPAALTKQREVLRKMVNQKLITEAESEKALSEELKFQPLSKTRYSAPFFVDYVIGSLVAKFSEEELFKGGFKIYTTLDSVSQKAAEDAIEKTRDQGKKLNFSEMAILAIDPTNGYIKAMVGGVDYSKSQYNRTWQSRRQPGSAFKIFTYIAAFENGYSPGDIIDDSPVSYDTPQGPWDIQNYDYIFNGPTTLRDGLRLSRNVVTVKLLDMVGVDKVVAVARRMGINSNLEPNLSLALGTSDVTMMELVSAFGIIPAGGVHFKPIAVLKVEDRFGNKIYEAPVAEPKIVLEKNIAGLMTELLQEVVTGGTGTHAYFGRPAGGKTGTTSDWKDAWFVGFTPELVAGVWLGNDDNKPTAKISGGSIPAETWKLFMMEAVKDQPARNFSEQPAGMVQVRICKVSGKIANNNCPPDKVTTEWFWEKQKPQEVCDQH